MSTTYRLWIHVRPEREDALDRCWTTQLAPRLEALGLQAQICQRPLPEGVAGWVFPVEPVRTVEQLCTLLQADPVWQRAMLSVARQDPTGTPRWGLDLFSAPVERQSHPIARGTRQGPWLMLDPHDGLPTCLISDLHTDHRGHLYMAAHEGLVHYDGATATLLNVAGNAMQFCRSVTVDDEADHVWVCPRGPGLVRWDGTQFSWYGVADGLPDEPLIPCAGAARRLWVCLSGGVAVRFDSERCEQIDLHLPKDTSIICAWSDGDADHLEGRHLLAGTDTGVWRTGAAARCLGLDGEKVFSLCRDTSGCLWVAAKDSIYRQTADGFETVPALGAIRRGAKLVPDTDGGLLFVGQDGGVRCWDGRHLTTYGSVPGTTMQASTLHRDDRGALWQGAWGSGLSRFDGHWIRSIEHESPSAVSRIETVCEDAEGRIWIGTWGGGVMRVEGNGAHVVDELTDCGAHLWSSLRDRDGRLWFGSFEQGAGCWDGERLRLVGAEQLGHASVWGMHQDRHGRMWFATQGGGLTCLDGEDATTYTTADGLPDNQVWCVVEDAAGDIWCSTFDSGVSRFDGKQFHSYTTADGLAHDQVWCMLRDRDGDLWFGTWGGGVSRYDGEHFTTFTTADGLANNSVRAIHQSRDGHMWFGTYGGGVSRFDGRVFQTFARRDGLGHDAVQSITEAADGTMWIATEIGVCSYTPPTRPPTIQIDGLVADRRYSPQAEDVIALRAGQGLVTVEFSGASFTTPRERLLFVYRLVGKEGTWQTTTRRRAELHDLPEGEHCLQVRAVDRDLNYSPAAEVRFRVEANADSDRLRALQAELAVPPGLEHFIGCSASLQRVFDEIETVAGSDLTVLILGETGTGKGLVARGIHAMSGRAGGPFIQVNCGAIPEGLVESELFGHEKGAFTGAVSRKIGRFELAEGGTLFLDEIGDLPLPSQRVLLHALQEAVFHRVGGQTPIQADVRVIAATNRRLDQSRDGTFRDDLYFRLSPFVLRVPPLRERQDDIPLLLGHFVESFARHLNRPIPEVGAEAAAVLTSYEWPGNVRELEHVAQRAVLVCRGGVIVPADLAVGDQDRREPVGATEQAVAATLDELDQHLSEVERAQLLRVLEETNWVIYGERGAARRLSTHPEKLRRRLRRLGLRRSG